MTRRGVAVFIVGVFCGVAFQFIRSLVMLALLWFVILSAFWWPEKWYVVISFVGNCWRLLFGIS